VCERAFFLSVGWVTLYAPLLHYKTVSELFFWWSPSVYIRILRSPTSFSSWPSAKARMAQWRDRWVCRQSNLLPSPPPPRRRCPRRERAIFPPGLYGLSVSSLSLLRVRRQRRRTGMASSSSSCRSGFLIWWTSSLTRSKVNCHYLASFLSRGYMLFGLLFKLDDFSSYIWFGYSNSCLYFMRLGRVSY